MLGERERWLFAFFGGRFFLQEFFCVGEFLFGKVFLRERVLFWEIPKGVFRKLVRRKQVRNPQEYGRQALR